MRHVKTHNTAISIIGTGAEKVPRKSSWERKGRLHISNKPTISIRMLSLMREWRFDLPHRLGEETIKDRPNIALDKLSVIVCRDFQIKTAEGTQSVRTPALMTNARILSCNFITSDSSGTNRNRKVATPIKTAIILKLISITLLECLILVVIGPLILRTVRIDISQWDRIPT